MDQYEQQSLIISDRPSYIGMMVALPFLFITFVIFAFVELKNGHAQILLGHLGSLFSYYLFCVVADDIQEQVGSATCIILALLIIYFLLATFCWLNVLCINIWINIRDERGYWDSVTMEKRRRFLYYSGYAWGVPLLIVILILTLSKTVKLHTWYNPGLADANCWLNDGIPEFMNLHLPLTITVVADVVFLSLTAYKIKMADQEEVSTSSRKKMFLKLYQHTELFVISFIIWLMEIIAWSLKFGKVPSRFWYTMEVCNAASGILIFLLGIVFHTKMRTLTLKRFRDIKSNWHNRKRYAVDETPPPQN